MSRGVNRVTLVGNLGNDPEITYTAGGMCIATLSIATTSSRKDKDGNVEEKTEWHRCKAFGKLGEICGEYLTKGRQVYVEGKLVYGSYEKEGVKHYTTDILLDQMQMLGTNPAGGERTQQPAQQRTAPPAQRNGANREPRPPVVYDDVPFDDDLPF